MVYPTAKILTKGPVMAEHKHGEMDITVQEKTFAGFMSMVSKGTIIIIVALIFLALIGA